MTTYQRVGEFKRVAWYLPGDDHLSRAVKLGFYRYVRPEHPWMCVYMERLDREIIAELAPDALLVRARYPNEIEFVNELEIPTVVVTGLEAPRRAPRLWTDLDAVTNLAVDYLTGLGYRSLAWTGSLCVKDEFFGFGEAFRREVVRRGLECRASLDDIPLEFHPPAPDPSDEWLDWLAGLPKPCGIFCTDDAAGNAIMNHCREYGLPTMNFGVLGVGNNPMACQIAHPSLSSIDLDGERIGYAAGRLIQAIFDGETVPGETLVPPLQVIARNSTFESRRMDSEVGRAVRHMREHIHKQLRVEDVAEHVGMSRRTLERKFQEAFGFSPAEMLRRYRVQRAQELLLETDWEIRRVATEVGFQHSRHFISLFRAMTGFTPADYRDRSRL
ncbi:MAG: helix-turn-helix domain-containing protein [Verrucomicrobiota bacterium]